MKNLKEIARKKVANTLKAGKLVRPSSCDRCHQPGRASSDGRATIHAHHHKGYELPLAIIWLCPSCHFQEDKRPSKEANGRAKLNNESVSLIRATYKPGVNTMRSLAGEFGVSLATISRVVRNVNWIDESLHGSLPLTTPLTKEQAEELTRRAT